MARRAQPEDELTPADREAIAAIRREIDAEFGPLEPPAPLAVESSPPARPSARSPASPRARPRAVVRAMPLVLLGALVGGAVGGVTGGITTLVWLHYAERPARAPAASTESERSMPAAGRGASAPSIERGTTGTGDPAATSHQPRPDAELESALNDWLTATRTGDIDAQMRFYPARVAVYYTWRNVARQAVRTEKLRVFGAATRLEITTDAPTIELTDGGDSAVSRFRKRYVIEGPHVRRRGEVLQELRWARMPDGWRIVVERDAEVLVPRAAVGRGFAARGGTIDGAR